jgi:hypothetical protein
MRPKDRCTSQKIVFYLRAKQLFAGEEIKQQILMSRIRKVRREIGLSHHTIDKILKGEKVRRKTWARIIKKFQADDRKAAKISGK